MASQGSGPEVVENDRNEANKSDINCSTAKNPSSSPSSADYLFVNCSLSELSYCYCVDESIRTTSERSASRRKLKTLIEPFDFNSYKADMLSQLSTKQLLLNRKPTLIDNLISRNRSALLQNQMEGRRGSGSGNCNAPGRPGRPLRNQQQGRKGREQSTGRPSTSLDRKKVKELVTGDKRKRRSNSIDTASVAAIKRIKKSLKEEGEETSDGGGSTSSNTSRNTSLERVSDRNKKTSAQLVPTNVAPKKKKMVKKTSEHFRSSARFVSLLRSGKKRFDQSSFQQLDLKSGGKASKKIAENAVKSESALSKKRKCPGLKIQPGDKKPPNVQKTTPPKKPTSNTDSNSNLFVKESSNAEPGISDAKQAAVKEGQPIRKRGRPRLNKPGAMAKLGIKDKLLKSGNSSGATTRSSTNQPDKKDTVSTLIRKKRRKRDSMWCQTVKRYLKSKLEAKRPIPTSKQNVMEKSEENKKQEQESDPPSLDSVISPVTPENERKPDPVEGVDAEPKMPVLEVENALLENLVCDKETENKTGQINENTLSNGSSEDKEIIEDADQIISNMEAETTKEDGSSKIILTEIDKDSTKIPASEEKFYENNEKVDIEEVIDEVKELVHIKDGEEDLEPDRTESESIKINEAILNVEEEDVSKSQSDSNDEIGDLGESESEIQEMSPCLPPLDEESKDVESINESPDVTLIENDSISEHDSHIESNTNVNISSIENEIPQNISNQEDNVDTLSEDLNEAEEALVEEDSIPIINRQETELEENLSENNTEDDSNKPIEAEDKSVIIGSSENVSLPLEEVEKTNSEADASFHKTEVDSVMILNADLPFEGGVASSPKVETENSVDTNFNSCILAEENCTSETSKEDEPLDPKCKITPENDCLNDADSTCDNNTSALDEPTSGDDSFCDISLYLPIEELDQLKEAKESDNSCGSFTNMSDTAGDSNQVKENEVVDTSEEKDKDLCSTEIQETVNDLTEPIEETNEQVSETVTEMLKTTSEEDSCKDSGIQLEEPFSDKENSASNSFPENDKLDADPCLNAEGTKVEQENVCIQDLEIKPQSDDGFPQAEETSGMDVVEKVETEGVEKDEKVIEQDLTNAENDAIPEETNTSVESQAMKEAVLQALGLKSLCPTSTSQEVPVAAEKPKRIQDSGYTGTLKAVIKLNRGGDKKSRTMVYRRSDDKTAIDKLEYKMICSEGQDGETTPSVNDDGSYLNTSTVKLQQTHSSHISKASSHQSDSPECENINGSQSQGAEDFETDDKTGGKESNLIIPEKSSSFSIHPGKLCSDVCTYCFGKFGSLDTPCHVAQLKDKERQRKILENETHLTVESCLCDACYRYVDRRANFPNATSNRTKARPKPPASSICCVTNCEELATHTVKKKWLFKLKKSISNKLDIDMEKPGSMYYPLCTQHHYWVDYFTVCGICRKRLNRNHLYSLGPETDRLNLMLAEDGIPARLSDKLFICKLCRYYSNLRLKYSDPSNIPSANQPFYRSYRKKILTSLEVPVSDSEEEIQVMDKKKKKSQGDTEKSLKPGNESKNGSGETSELGDEMALRGLATLLGDQPAEQQTRIQVKFGNVNIGTLSNLNIGQHGRGGDDRPPRRYMSNTGTGAETSHLPLSAHLDFQGSSTPDGSWERCISTIQFDKRTKKLWQELQRPYGSQSSFLRHLVMLEKYWRSGYLVLSDGADPKAAKYVNSVLNRLKAFEGGGAHSEAKATSSVPNVSSNSSTSTSLKTEDILKIPTVKRYQDDCTTRDSSDSFRPVINTSEIEVTPIGPAKVSLTPQHMVTCQLYQSPTSSAPRTSTPMLPSHQNKANGSVGGLLKRENTSTPAMSQPMRLLEVGGSRHQTIQRDGVKKSPVTLSQTALSRAKALVKTVSPTSANQQHSSSPYANTSRCTPKSQQMRIQQYPHSGVPGGENLAGRFVTVGAPQGQVMTSKSSPGAPPPLLKITSSGSQLPTVPSYMLSLAPTPSQLSHNSQGVQLLLPQGVASPLPPPLQSGLPSDFVGVIPRGHPFNSPQQTKSPLPQPYHTHPSIINSAVYSKAKPLKPILPKLPKALTVTQVSAGITGPAITLHGSGITIEKQSGNSPVTPAILPPEKPSISVFREPMPTPD